MSTPKLSRDAVLELAVAHLNDLIILSGFEYPDALYSAAFKFGLVNDSETIQQMYDAQFE